MIKLGIDRILEHIELFENKRVGLITNPTGVNSDLVSTAKIVHKHLNLTTLFSPEHGFRGDLQAGVRLDDYIDDEYHCPVYSLYGKNKKPTKEMLEDIDIICFDIQDVGARFYTYIYTMAYAMIAASEHNKSFVVFDRPNPLGGNAIEGNILDISYRSFVGYYPLLQRYGLTIGELAMLFNEAYEINCDLTVIEMEGYQRNMYYEDTGLVFIAPSPNLPTMESTIHYAGTCIFEGTNVSEGRGTTKPFSLIGAPWLNVDAVINEMNKEDNKGVVFRKVFFTPMFSKHKGALCNGIELHITNKQQYKPVITGMKLLKIIESLHEEFQYNKPYKEGLNPMISLLSGSDFLLNKTKNIEEIMQLFIKDQQSFKLVKERYHIYE